MNQITALIALGAILVAGLIVIPVVGIRNAQALGWCFSYDYGTGIKSACFKTEEECRSAETYPTIFQYGLHHLLFLL
ncbi:MAG: hypothetical protein ACJ71X_09480 [Nitrososphaeraceae archaeon]